jgi:ethanolamine utilization protein EutN
MVICRVVGTVVSTVKHPAYQGWKLLVVQPMHLPGEAEEEAFLAIDAAHAGVGDAVLVMREGNGARQITGNPEAPIISVVVGVLDSVQMAA